MIILPDQNAVGSLCESVRHATTVFLYIGPDQIMPLTSILGALAGIALMFWNRVVGIAHKLLAIVRRRDETPGKPSAH